MPFKMVWPDKKKKGNTPSMKRMVYKFLGDH